MRGSRAKRGRGRRRTRQRRAGGKRARLGCAGVGGPRFRTPEGNPTHRSARMRLRAAHRRRRVRPEDRVREQRLDSAQRSHRGRALRGDELRPRGRRRESLGSHRRGRGDGGAATCIRGCAPGSRFSITPSSHGPAPMGPSVSPGSRRASTRSRHGTNGSGERRFARPYSPDRRPTSRSAIRLESLYRRGVIVQMVHADEADQDDQRQ